MSNKKYLFIPEGEALLEILKEKSIGDYAKELAEETGIDYRTLHSSITWKRNRYFDTEQKKQVLKSKNKRSNWQIEQDKLAEANKKKKKRKF